MNLQEYIKKLEAAQAALPEMLADVARNATISGLDPAAIYRLTISYDSSRYYLYGGLKVEGVG